MYVHLPKHVRTKLELVQSNVCFWVRGAHRKGIDVLIQPKNGIILFYQLSSQGENEIEDPSWLIYLGRIDPKEQVGNTTETTSKSIVLPLLPQFTLVPEHPESPEVIDNTSHNVMTDDVNDAVLNDEPNVETNDEQSTEETNRYI